MKNKNRLYVWGAIIAALLVFLIIRGSEDDWICVDDQWVKHGEPSAEQPETGCGDDQVLAINNFWDCLEAGNPAMESYPRQCRDDQDNLFVEDIGNELEKTDIIRLNSPRPNQVVASPLVIEGEARGTWFFEGDFPVQLFDENDNLIATAIAQAQSDWMTEDFVSFEVELEFNVPDTERGILILQKDNPSGLSENDDQLRIPIIF